MCGLSSLVEFNCHCKARLNWEMNWLNKYPISLNRTCGCWHLLKQSWDLLLLHHCLWVCYGYNKEKPWFGLLCGRLFCRGKFPLVFQFRFWWFVWYANIVVTLLWNCGFIACLYSIYDVGMIVKWSNSLDFTTYDWITRLRRQALRFRETVVNELGDPAESKRSAGVLDYKNTTVWTENSVPRVAYLNHVWRIYKKLLSPYVHLSCVRYTHHIPARWRA